MINDNTRSEIKKLLKECISSEEDKDKVRTLFVELMQDKASWDKFLRYVIPHSSKGLDVVTVSEFDEFKKITFEEIDKWKI